MSQPSSFDPIPTVIPVARRRKPRKKLPIFSANVPWAKFAIGGAAFWMFATVVVALYFGARGDRIAIDDGDLPPVPAVKHNLPQQVVVQNAPQLPMPAVAREVAAKEVVAREVKRPEAEPDAWPAKAEFVDCKQIGTDVRFFKDPTEAFKRARAEKKMVFMMHLSGNLEDKDFT